MRSSLFTKSSAYDDGPDELMSRMGVNDRDLELDQHIPVTTSNATPLGRAHSAAFCSLQLWVSHPIAEVDVELRETLVQGHPSPPSSTSGKVLITCLAR